MASIAIRRGETDDQMVTVSKNFEQLHQKGQGASSIDQLLLALGSCTFGTIRSFLQRKSLPVDGLRVELSSDLDEAADRYGDIRIRLSVNDEIPAALRQTIKNVAKTCRIHKTLRHGPEIEITAHEGPGDARNEGQI